MTPRIEITTDGRTTTARMFRDGKEVHKAEATCRADEPFAFGTGELLALNRLLYDRDYQTASPDNLANWSIRLRSVMNEIDAVSKR